MTREEHMEWTKKRAIEYVEQGDSAGALASLFSDLNKHPETQSHSAITLGSMLMFSGMLSTPEAVKKFIEDCN